MKRVIASTDRTFQNKKNPNKFIETRKYDDGHTVARQYMEWETEDGTVRNYTGAKDAKRGRYSRLGQKSLGPILEDYEEVVEGSDSAVAEPIPPSADDLFDIVRKYFTVEGISCRGSVSFSDYDIYKGTFRVQSNYMRSSADVWMSESDVDRGYMNEFKKAVRTYLKRYGWTKVKFNIKSYKYKYEWWGEYRYDTRKQLIAIYFDN